MRPVYQSRQGRGGDCLPAAVATVLDLPLNAVPDFMSEPNAMHTWPVLLGTWLAGRGIEMVPVAPHGDLAAALAHMGEFYPNEFYLLGGRTGDIDHGHVVVGHGGRIVHDPSPEPATFSGPVPALGRYLALLLRPMPSPVLPAPIDLEPLS